MASKLNTLIDKNPDWRAAFRSASLRVGFQVSLSRAMLEMLCAVSDGVQWDRALYPSLHVPDNWVATNASLFKRGLIERRPQAAIDREIARARASDERINMYEWNHWQLTDAGRLVVKLVQLAGVFVESDVAIGKKSRRA